MSSREETSILAVREGASTHTAAESVGRSRRRHWQRFIASVALRSRLFRQRYGVPDLHADAARAGQAVAILNKSVAGMPEMSRTRGRPTFGSFRG